MSIKKNLHKLVGTWQSSGVIIDGGENDGVTIIGTDQYEWLGDQLMVHHVDVMFGDTPQRSIEIFQLTDAGFDMTAYNDDGTVEHVTGTFDEAGVYHAGDDNVRATLKIADDAKTMHAVWQMKAEGEWRDWMTMSFHR